MSNITWDELVGQLAPYIVFYDMQRTNQEVKKVIAMATRDAVIEVAERLDGFRRVGKLNIQGNVCHYHIETDDAWRVHRIPCVWVNGQCYGTYLGDCGPMQGPFYEFHPDDCTLTLGSVPGQDISGGLKMDMRMIPTVRSCGIPQKLFDHYRTIIRYKTLSLLYDMGAQQWHSEGKSRSQERKFNRALNDELWNNHTRHSGNSYVLQSVNFLE